MHFPPYEECADQPQITEFNTDDIFLGATWEGHPLNAIEFLLEVWEFLRENPQRQTTEYPLLHMGEFPEYGRFILQDWLRDNSWSSDEFPIGEEKRRYEKLMKELDAISKA